MKKLYIYCGVMLCLIAICLVFLVIYPKAAISAKPHRETETAETQTEAPDTQPAETDLPDEVLYKCPEKLTEAHTRNKDAYAWLSIPGTDIDYPIVQSPDNDLFYLRRDIDGNYLISGMLLTEHTYNSTLFDDPVTVIYGHCMESGAMFGSLQDLYSPEGGIEKYKTIEIYLPDKKLEYEVFAAVPYDTRHILFNYDFSDPRVFTSFFRSIVTTRSFNAAINASARPDVGDKVLILSTCLKGDSTHRYLVIAKLK